MTTFSLCTPSLLALSFPPKATPSPRNTRRGVDKRQILGALYRLARESQPASLQDLALVIGCADVHTLLLPLSQLAADGMIHKQGSRIALSLLGFATAAALHTPAKRNVRRAARGS